MLLGVDYYPEQWDTSLMDADMDRILELGCNVIRIGEFAWHRMEKQEGQFDFSYFDGVIAMAKQKDLQVIFGTPTATPPAWFIAKYPDILSRFPDGSPRAFGGRPAIPTPITWKPAVRSSRPWPSITGARRAS